MLECVSSADDVAEVLLRDWETKGLLEMVERCAYCDLWWVCSRWIPELMKSTADVAVEYVVGGLLETWLTRLETDPG